MATTNVNKPRGFVPTRYLNGASWNGQMSLYGFSASDSVDAYIYDVCNFDSTNRTAALTDQYYPALPFVGVVASDITTAAQRGVVVGFIPQPDFNMSVSASLGLKYRVASTARYAWVVDDPFVIYESQEDTSTYTSTSSNGLNKVVGTLYTAGNTTTGMSKSVLKAASVVTNALRPFRLYRYLPTINNFGWVAADTPTYARWEIFATNSDLFGSAIMTQEGV